MSTRHGIFAVLFPHLMNEIDYGTSENRQRDNGKLANERLRAAFSEGSVTSSHFLLPRKADCPIPRGKRIQQLRSM